MAKNIEILKQLQTKRISNVSAVANWSASDFEAMLSTYLQAKNIALESNDIEAVSILDEKISQLNEAISLRSNDAELL